MQLNEVYSRDVVVTKWLNVQFYRHFYFTQFTDFDMELWGNIKEYTECSRRSTELWLISKVTQTRIRVRLVHMEDYSMVHSDQYSQKRWNEIQQRQDEVQHTKHTAGKIQRNELQISTLRRVWTYNVQDKGYHPHPRCRLNNNYLLIYLSIYLFFHREIHPLESQSISQNISHSSAGSQHTVVLR